MDGALDSAIGWHYGLWLCTYLLTSLLIYGKFKFFAGKQKTCRLV